MTFAFYQKPILCSKLLSKDKLREGKLFLQYQRAGSPGRGAPGWQLVLLSYDLVPQWPEPQLWKFQQWPQGAQGPSLCLSTLTLSRTLDATLASRSGAAPSLGVTVPWLCPLGVPTSSQPYQPPTITPPTQAAPGHSLWHSRKRNINKGRRYSCYHYKHKYAHNLCGDWQIRMIWG